MKSCIQVSRLSKVYHRRQVVKSISFQVGQGQIFALLGPNGAGKSTTMNMISTLLDKSGGSIQIDGLDMDLRQAEIKQKIGIVFQNDVLDDDLTVYKNLLYRGGLYPSGQGAVKERVGRIARLLSLEPLLAKRYRECSGGQKRLVQIGRALLPAPKLLILDEPTTGLDPITRKMVWDVLLRLRGELNMTIFFTTHYLDEALYADQFCILKDGTVLLCGSLDQLKRKPVREAGIENLDSLYFHLLSGGGGS